MFTEKLIPVRRYKVVDVIEYVYIVV